MRKYIRELYRIMLYFGTALFGIKFMKQFDAKVRFGRKLNLDTPKTLSDKICYLELNNSNSVTIKCTDKYEVRKYVSSKGYKELLVPLYGDVYESEKEVDFDKLPNKFVLKATHGCEMNIICKDKTQLNYKQCRKIMKRWLKSKFWRGCLEPHYLSIPHRIICEKYLEDSDSIIDYKIHCSNGIPQFILACSERARGVKLNLYDTNWNPIRELQGHHKNNKEIPRPKKLDEMLKISRDLARDFKFVRVDLYEISGKVYFGELTFTPATGVLPNMTDRFLENQGTLLNLN